MATTRKALAAQNREMAQRLAAAQPEARAGLRRRMAETLSRAELAEARLAKAEVRIAELTAAAKAS